MSCSIRNPASRAVFVSAVAVASSLLAGCDLDAMISGNMPTADAQATGAACRHVMRSVEECHSRNPTASRAAIYAGWKEMDQYMRENKLEGMPAAPAADRKGNGAERTAADDEGEEEALRDSAKGPARKKSG